MLPVIQFGPLALPTYPLALLLALWVGLAIAARAAKQTGLDGDHIYNAGLYALAAGLIAGRLAHVAVYWPAYRAQPLEIIGLNSRAFLAWPGLIAALVVALWYAFRHRLAWGALLDVVAPGILIGLAIASLGALLSGRALGAPADLPWSVTLWGVPRHPSQIYEAVAYLAVAGIVLAAIRRAKPRTPQAQPGTPAWIAVLGFGLIHWLLEPFRADSTLMLGSLRAAQVFGLLLALCALWALQRRAKN